MAASTAARTTGWVVPLSLAIWLSACAGEPPLAAFDLAPAASRPQRTLRAQVHVLDPVAPSDLESDRILVRTEPAGLAVMAGARWSEPLPVMLQKRLIESLQNAQDAPRVDDGSPPTYDYDLETDVREFELDADKKEVGIELVIKLVSARDHHIVAVKTFKTQAPVASTDANVVTAALNGALAGLMTQVVSFVTASASAMVRR
jgi:cholesterol transport system auxiliary component